MPGDAPIAPVTATARSEGRAVNDCVPSTDDPRIRGTLGDLQVIKRGVDIRKCLRIQSLRESRMHTLHNYGQTLLAARLRKLS